MAYHFVIADVFTQTIFGGNQLAVFPDAQGLSDRTMQALAREFNFAETTFVLPPGDPANTARLRIFTPKSEVPFAGHPTIGTAAVLAGLGRAPAPGGASRIVFEEGVGPVAVDVQTSHRGIFARLTLHRAIDTHDAVPTRASAAAALGLREEQVNSLAFASAGLPFCLIHLSDKEATDRAAINRAEWLSSFANGWSPNLFIYAGDLRPGSGLYARMFAPALGIEEDPATGSACAALAGALANRLDERDGTFAWEIDQGVALGRPSHIEVTAHKRDGRAVTLTVGGYSVIVGDGAINHSA
jgi:trans-2,3-dihydro-3-hydroxyanthranilate isomerase